MPTIDWDDAFDNFGHIAQSATYPPRWSDAAAAYRAQLGARAETGIAYGDHPREVFDLFRPEGPARGVVVFVHGGYWLRNDRSMWSHFAAGALAQGWAMAIPSYILAPEARVSAITRQIAAAIEAAAARVAGPIRLAGHSAGGHLVARMACADTSTGRAFDGRIARILSISGLHDLRPLLHTRMNDGLRLDAAEAAAESVVLLQKARAIPVTAWVGGAERPVFLDQADALASAWPDTVAHVDPGRHHFDVIDGLADPASPLMRALLS
jgi:arylformamidase